MVRRIVGTLVEIGRNNLTENDLNIFLSAKSNIPAKLTAPPSGLYLENVYYKGDKIITELNPFSLIKYFKFKSKK